MLSNKMTVSLMSLITIFAFAFVVSPVMANTIKLRVDDANRAGSGDPADVSAADGIQVIAGANASIRLDAEEPLVPESITADDFVVIGAQITATVGTTVGTNITASEGNKRFLIPLADPAAGTDNDHDTEITIILVPKKLQSANTGDSDSSGVTLKFKYVNPDSSEDSPTVDGPNDPKVISITRATAIGSTIASAFVEEVVSGEFLVKIVLTEKPNGGLASAKVADRIKALSVSAGKATNVVPGISFARVETSGSENPPLSEGGYAAGDGSDATHVPLPTGRDAKYYPYLATIMPDGSEDKVVIQVNDFKDLVLVQGEGADAIMSGMYRKPAEKAATNGRDKLEVKVTKNPATAKTAGLTVAIPNDIIIPANGYLVAAKDDGDGDDNHEKRTDSTAVVYPGDPKDAEILVGDRQPAQRMYNVIKAGLPNLETFLTNGGTIVLMGPEGLVISEIMWGSDASLTESFESQWIEIMNPGAQVKTKDVKLVFYGPGASDQAAVAALDATKVADTVGTVGASGYWSIVGKGQSGRTGVGEAPGDIVAVTPTQALISMQRVIDAAGMAADGTMSSSWAASVPPGLNFNTNVEGTRIGSPGASPAAYPVAPTPTPAPAPATPIADAMDIMITEIMVDTGSGRLPQWIELTNVSGAEKSLAGWSLMITNDATDDGVIGATVNINLSGTLGVGGGEDAGGTMGKSLLLVGGTARSSSNLAGSDRVVDISSQVDQRGRYAFISSLGFMAALIPPQKTGILAYGDTAGNLEGGWDLPMDESGRSSLIRREELDDKMATMGTDANGWILASSTPLVRGPATWYGSDEDAGTPGYDAGGPLPVELSHFRPARDKATGAVVITWSTQSELNNAGFFIKRSQQRNGQFKVINATMVAGAGTTSEKQFYTYTDTTAQPNVVYYYQIEDVSLDGNRQTLTNGIRLKGHIGAAGKLTTTWGDLKTSHE
ncbi:MAG: hypothetical protein OXL96_08880 [Candidatus Poribacteria bacterium]|nr:hypothetical protein [Candidatus Poribacteria bacterium]